MCLAIPAQLVSEPNEIQMAEVDILGVKRHICTMMAPAAKKGDHVLVHAGFAIQIIDEEFAAESLEMLRSMGIKTAEDIEAELAEAEGSGASEAPAS
ncbi:MAG: HypC/HybG/HupF family hydrogenase formation chaperone [Aeromicrobium sp.]|jgi:hydrogenase expression/formation protein HypC|nr:HypC/HybG/HupF family hydrogenase formation chaperone [Aeromicrobium sp.]